MTHAAIQIRDAVIALLEASATFVGNVGTLGKVPLGEDQLPYTAVYLGRDEPKQLSTGANALIITEDELILRHMIKQKGDAEAAAFALDLAARKLLADNRLAGLLQRITPGPRGMADPEQLDLPCYALERVFRVQYHTRVTTPDITL